MLKHEERMELAQFHQPIVYLHSEEEYFPITFSSYVKQSILLEMPAEKMIDDDVTIEKIGTEYAPLNNTVLKIPNNVYTSSLEQGCTTPFYVSFTETEEELRIVYWFYYAYSGPLYICCPRTSCKRVPKGEHQSDFEHVSFYIKKNQKDRIDRAYYSAHRDVDGVLVNGSDLEYEMEHPIVYSALATHACYPKAQTWGRICGFANDVTNQGYKWFPTLEFIDENTIWNKFTGHIGYPDHGKTPLQKSSWIVEPQTSTNWFKRLFCCLCV